MATGFFKFASRPLLWAVILSFPFLLWNSSRLKSNNETETWLPRGTPVRVEYERFKRDFGADALVQSTVTTPGDSQSVGYRLGKVGNDWKIYDIDMSGAWLIQVYQGQFKSQLASGGIDGLIAYLQKHNSRTN